MNQERRSSRREIVPSLVYLDLQPNNGGILLDLNASGMQVSVAHPLANAKSVRFSFGLDSSTRIEGTGRVAWIAESGKTAGICFVDLPESSLGQIDQWLKSATSTGTVQAPDDPAPATTQKTETESESSCPPVSPAVPEIQPPAAPVTATVFQTTIEKEERRWDPPPEAEAASAVAEELRPSPEPCILGIQPPAAPETATVFQTTIEREERRWDPPPEAETTPIVAAERQPPSTVDSWEPGFEWTAEQARIEAETTTTAPGVNDLNAPLPVFTMPSCAPAPASTHLASQVIFDELRQFGWGLERDWHVGLGTLLLAAGFLPLWQHPPLVILTVVLWIVSVLLLTSRKQPPNDWKKPNSERSSHVMEKEERGASAASAGDRATTGIGSPSETGGAWTANRTPVGEER